MICEPNVIVREGQNQRRSDDENGDWSNVAAIMQCNRLQMMEKPKKYTLPQILERS